MQIDARIPLMAQGPQPDQRMNMLAQIMQFQQMMQKNKLLEQEQLLNQNKMEHENALRPLQMRKYEAEIAALPALEAQRMAQVREQERRAQLADRQLQGQNALLRLFSDGGYQGAMQEGTPRNVMLDADAAREEAKRQYLENLRTGSDKPIGINVPNPNMLRSAAIMANPDKAIPEVLNQLSGAPGKGATNLSKLIAERDKLPLDDPRRAVFDDAIKKASTHPEPMNVYTGGLQAGIGPDGKPIFVQGSGRPGVDPRVVPPDVARPPPSPGETRIGVLGANESAQLNRVLMGGNQVAKALGNIVKLPVTASSGIFGGRVQGKSLFEAGKEALTNTLTTQDVQSYNVLTTGIQRAMAAIESSGLAPSNALMHMMQNVTLKEGDTHFTKLLKLAETRQVVEAGYEVILSNPRVSETQKAQASKALDEIRKHVPFTVNEVLQLGSLQNTRPNLTLKMLMEEAKSGNPTTQDGWSIRPK